MRSEPEVRDDEAAERDVHEAREDAEEEDMYEDDDEEDVRSGRASADVQTPPLPPFNVVRCRNCQVELLPDWNCCGASYATHVAAGNALLARPSGSAT